MTKYVTYPDETRHIYNLYAVSCHIGDYTMGHHYTITKINGEWILLNDDSFDYISRKDEVVTSSAYILFYQRQDAE